MSTEKKHDFIKLLASMSNEEINEFIVTHGKPPKKVVFYHLIDKKSKEGI